jgi:hypothetical protein
VGLLLLLILQFINSTFKENQHPRFAWSFVKGHNKDLIQLIIDYKSILNLFISADLSKKEQTILSIGCLGYCSVLAQQFAELLNK